jgi:hypothetical protein
MQQAHVEIHSQYFRDMLFLLLFSYPPLKIHLIKYLGPSRWSSRCCECNLWSSNPDYRRLCDLQSWTLVLLSSKAMIMFWWVSSQSPSSLQLVKEQSYWFSFTHNCWICGLLGLPYTAPPWLPQPYLPVSLFIQLTWNQKYFLTI